MNNWRRYLPFVLIFAGAGALVLILNSFEAEYPSRAADGAPWDESWVMLGSALGVEEPGNGLVLLDNNTALAADDTFLATWASGDPIPYVNADGDDAEIYEAQVYLLLMGCKDHENAAKNVESWIARTGETYAVTDTRAELCNGQEYTLLIYECSSDANPYGRGASAFAVFENYAVSVELNCLEEYPGDEAAILAAFLSGCHYSADLSA